MGWESENINNIPKWATAQPHGDAPMGDAPMGSPYFFTAKTGRCKVKKRWSNICVLFQGSNLVRPLHREPSRSLAFAFLKMLWPQVQLWKMFWINDALQQQLWKNITNGCHESDWMLLLFLSLILERYFLDFFSFVLNVSAFFTVFVLHWLLLLSCIF